jgi:hypothetical protein
MEPGIMDILLFSYAWKEPNHLTLSYAGRHTVATNDSELHSLTPETFVLQLASASCYLNSEVHSFVGLLEYSLRTNRKCATKE